MATTITSECINCGACEPECPNTAIYQGGVPWVDAQGTEHPPLSNDIFYIVPEKCTECVGFFDHEACAAVCPVDCCVPDPQRPESHEALLARARTLHPDKTIADDAPSRFHKDGAAAPAGNGAAGAPTAAPPAVPAPAAAVAASRPVAVARGRVEKPVAKTAAPQAAKRFAGELPIGFDELAQQLGTPRRRLGSVLGYFPLVLIAALQGVLGALPAKAKADIEASISDRRFFSAALATAANCMLNLILYPVVALVLAIKAGRTELFSGGVHGWILLGLLVASLESMIRLRESFFGGRAFSESTLGAAFYGVGLLWLRRVVLAFAGQRGAESTVGFDGFSRSHERYDDKLERERRYGNVYRVEERDDAYLVHLEFPRLVPPSSLGAELGLPRDMPEYDYAVSLADGTLLVHGKVVDPQVRKLTAVAPAFPSEFTTPVKLAAPVTGFRHRYRDRTLEVILPKAR